MATRFYLQSTGATDISPAFDAEWDKTNNAERHPCATTKANTSMNDIRVVNPSVAANHDVLVAQFISDPLAAQTITGTVTGQVLAEQGNSLWNFHTQIILRVVSSTGSTVRGTLYAGTATTGTSSPTNEFATSLTNRSFPHTGTATLTSVSAQLGDRLVIEIGGRAHYSTSGTKDITFTIGDNNASDLAAGNTGTTENNPWIQLSANLTFQPLNVPNRRRRSAVY